MSEIKKVYVAPKWIIGCGIDSPKTRYYYWQSRRRFELREDAFFPWEFFSEYNPAPYQRGNN